MSVSEELREKGLGKPDFTKEELMDAIRKKFDGRGSAGFVIGRHVVTNLSSTIGDCNPYNRKFLYKWLDEEGFHYYSIFNGYGVESIKITL